MQHASKLRSVLVLATVALSGCAHTASFHQIQPARVDLGIRRLVLLDVAGHPKWKGTAAATLLADLRRSGFYDITTEADLQRVASAPLRFQDGNVNLAIALEAARRVGTEAVLITRLRYLENGSRPYGSTTIQLGDPDITATLSYELVDVMSGRVVQQDVVQSKSFQGELDGSQTGPTSETQVLSGLGTDAASKLAKLLAPHEELVEVPLARKWFGSESKEIREGSSAARQNDWISAMQHWQAALRENPQSDVAWYNLGLAYEATGDFPRAQEALQTALSIEEEEIYLEASHRLEFAAEGVRIAQLQRSRPPRLASMGPFGRPQQYASAAPYSGPRYRNSLEQSPLPQGPLEHGPPYLSSRPNQSAAQGTSPRYTTAPPQRVAPPARTAQGVAPAQFQQR